MLIVRVSGAGSVYGVQSAFSPFMKPPDMRSLPRLYAPYVVLTAQPGSVGAPRASPPMQKRQRQRGLRQMSASQPLRAREFVFSPHHRQACRASCVGKSARLATSRPESGKRAGEAGGRRQTRSQRRVRGRWAGEYQ